MNEIRGVTPLIALSQEIEQDERANSATTKLLPNYAVKHPQNRIGVFFRASKGKPVKTYIWKMMRQKAVKAGIEKRITFHSLRHTALTRLYEKTKDIRLVQEIAGHSDISTTMIYTHISGADIREAMINL